MSACPSCSVDQYVAERSDIYRAAHALLRNLFDRDDDRPHDPEDVLRLAMFLAGDHAP
ncbi:hypothetical protein ACMA1D_10825 [Streptomyces sp. 796.1]|uniref:hypothetical protein n=1 Tax=Streptomyces sp. 796.1 TaxID=3163029 RepID=UPI0039C968E0